MQCLRCQVAFSPSDIMLMEEDELPICDACLAEEYHIQVVYDGKDDLLDFLTNEVTKYICNKCIREQLILERINFGNPVHAFVKCPSCKLNDQMRIYIRYI